MPCDEISGKHPIGSLGLLMIVMMTVTLTRILCVFFVGGGRWYENTLWLEECQCPVTIALSELDGVVPVHALAEYATRYQEQADAEKEREDETTEGSHKADVDVRVIMWRHLIHGQILINKSAQQELRQVMEEQLAGLASFYTAAPHTARFA